MRVRFCAAKLPRWGHRESGDTLEIIERSRGGFSVVMADGQGSGPPAKRISNLVAKKAISLLGEGTRDGAVARAVHDYLHAVKDGKVLSTLTIISVDLMTGTLLASRNGNAVVVVIPGPGREPDYLDERVEPIGVHNFMRPAIREYRLQQGLAVVAFTDGISAAGRRSGSYSPRWPLAFMLSRAEVSADLAEDLLSEAVDRDGEKPADDMTVLSMVVEGDDGEARVRRLSLSYPL